MAKQAAVKDDEKKLLATSRESAEQLLTLFEADAADTREAKPKRRAAGP